MRFFDKYFKRNDDDDEGHDNDIKMPGRWTLFAIVFAGAVLTILYVDNVMRVDKLLEDIQKINKKIEFIKNENELLKAKVNYLQSPERITKIAEEKLGMIKADHPPEIIKER